MRRLFDTKNKFLVARQAFARFKHGFLQSEEMLVYRNIYQWWCMGKCLPEQFWIYAKVLWYMLYDVILPKFETVADVIAKM